jgi:hypothetical protein
MTEENHGNPQSMAFPEMGFAICYLPNVTSHIYIYLGGLSRGLHKKWREYVNSNWLNINKELGCNKISSCINVSRIRALGKYVFKTKCKWENKVRGGFVLSPCKLSKLAPSGYASDIDIMPEVFLVPSSK